jgi:hypothetical protein
MKVEELRELLATQGVNSTVKVQVSGGSALVNILAVHNNTVDNSVVILVG